MQMLSLGAALRQEQQFTLLLQRFTQACRHFGIKWLAEIADDQANHATLPPAQHGCRTVTYETELLNGLVHARHGGRRDPSFAG